MVLLVYECMCSCSSDFVMLLVCSVACLCFAARAAHCSVTCHTFALMARSVSMLRSLFGVCLCGIVALRCFHTLVMLLQICFDSSDDDDVVAAAVQLPSQWHDWHRQRELRLPHQWMRSRTPCRHASLRNSCLLAPARILIIALCAGCDAPRGGTRRILATTRPS